MSIGTNEWTGVTLASGRYLVTGKLGEGGMGTVYRAKDRNLDADVVIKVPLRSMVTDAEFSRRFKDEIRSLVNLPHPHIVKVTDVGEYDGLPFAVMQYLPGGSLDERRAANAGRPFNPVDALSWLSGIAGALDYVHSRGYIHRDVKPGNILFDAEGHVFLGDFGVIKVLASAAAAHPSRTAVTGTGMVIGTVEYMAPELIMGESLDGKVDQYALAVTVYEMLRGRRPFEHELKTKVLVLHTTTPPASLCDLRPEISKGLSQAVLKGLAKDPRDRYVNCAAFATVVNSAAALSQAKSQPTCRQCGKIVAIPAGDFDRILASGGQVTCPDCKTTPVVSAGRAENPGKAAKTVPFTSPGSSPAKTAPMASAPNPNPNPSPDLPPTVREGARLQPPPLPPAFNATARLSQPTPAQAPRPRSEAQAPAAPATRAASVNWVKIGGAAALGSATALGALWLLLTNLVFTRPKDDAEGNSRQFARTAVPEPAKKFMPPPDWNPGRGDRGFRKNFPNAPAKKKAALGPDGERPRQRSVVPTPPVPPAEIVRPPREPAPPPNQPARRFRSPDRADPLPREPAPPPNQPAQAPPEAAENKTVPEKPAEKHEPAKPLPTAYEELKQVTIKLLPRKDGGKLRTFEECVNSGKGFRPLKLVEIDYDGQVGLKAVARNADTYVVMGRSRKGIATKTCLVFVPVSEVESTQNDR